MKNVLISLTVALGLSTPGLFAASPFREPLPLDLGPVQPFAGRSSMALADFNNDGFADVAVAHQHGRLAVLLNDGSPFAATKTTVIPELARSVAAADFNGDGKIDLVSMYSYEAVVWLGQGNGSFVEGPKVVTEQHAGAMAVADVNGDTRPDVIVAGSYGFDGGKLQVHFNSNGAGFAGSWSASLLYAPDSVIAPDLNADGRADVVLSTTGSGATNVFLGTSVNTLTSAWSDARNGAVATAELTGDAHRDLVVHDTTGTLHVFGGNGNGTFTLLRELQTAAASSVVCADLDGDGFQDLLSVGSIVTIHRGTGNGTFGGAAFFKGFSDKEQAAVRDFDRDGKLDLLSLSSTPSLRLLRGNGDGTFPTDRAHRVLLPYEWGTGASHTAVADYDGDEKPDVAVILRSSAGALSLALLRNDGAGGLQEPLSVAAFATGWVQDAVAARLNGDAYADLVVIVRDKPNADTAIPFLGGSGGTLARGTSFPVATADYTPLHVVDVTGDGTVDLLYGASIHEGNGDGTFDARRDTSATFSHIADVDEDGAPDALWWQGATLAVARNAGAGVFEAAVTVDNVRHSIAAVADFNEDGHVDLFGVRAGGSKTVVYAGRGDGTFADGSFIEAAIAEGVPVVADVDGDTHLDVAMFTNVLHGDGHGRFRDLSAVRAVAGAGDFDGNGTADLVSVSGGVALVQRSGLVAAGTTPTSTALVAAMPDGVEYGREAELTTTTTGGVLPVAGTVLYALNDVPYALAKVAPDSDDAPAGVSRHARALPVGQLTFTATYTGNATYAPSSVSVQQDVDRAATTLSAAPVQTAYPFGPSLQIGMKPSPGPTGNITVKEGEQVLATIQANASSHVPLEPMSVGTHTLTIEYAGDANYKPATTTVPVVVKKRTPTLFVDAAANVNAGAVPVIASFAANGGELTGSVSFVIHGQAAGTAAIQADRTARVISTLPAGTYSCTAHYSGDANNEAVSTEATIIIYGGDFGTPIVVDAKGGATTASLRWTPVRSAHTYVIHVRRTAASPAAMLTDTGVYTRTTIAMPAGTTWLVQVEAIAWGNQRSRSNWDLVTTAAFTDEPLASGTIMRARHVAELRTAANALRAFAGLPAFAFGETVPVRSPIRAAHVQTLRTAIGEARSAIGMPVTFTGTISAGTPVRGVHWSELRAGVD